MAKNYLAEKSMGQCIVMIPDSSVQLRVWPFFVECTAIETEGRILT